MSRFKSEDERTPVYLIIDEAFPPLLNIYNRLVQIPSPTIEIAELIKLICKIFWSSIYVCKLLLSTPRKPLLYLYLNIAYLIWMLN